MSTLVDKDIARRSSSIVENGAESNLSAGSSRDEYDEDAIDFKQNIVSRAAAAHTVVAAAARLSSHVNSIARAKEHHSNAINMGGITIPHHGLTAAFHGYHSHAAVAHSGGSGVGVGSTGSSSTHNISSNQHHFHYNNNGNGNGIINNGHNTSSSSSNNTNNHTNDTCKSPFLLPAQLYKSLFANAVLQNPDKMGSHPFPRNLLFSYSEKSPNSSDFETDEKSAATATDEVCSIHMFLLKYEQIFQLDKTIKDVCVLCMSDD